MNGLEVVEFKLDVFLFEIETNLFVLLLKHVEVVGVYAGKDAALPFSHAVEDVAPYFFHIFFVHVEIIQ